MAKAKRNSTSISKHDGRKGNGRKKGTKVGLTVEQQKLTPAKLNKAKKERVKLYAVNAIRKEFGSEEQYFEHVAREAKKSFNHLKFLHEYAYGKPEDYQHSGGQKQAPVINFYGNAPQPKEETIDIEHDDDN